MRLGTLRAGISTLSPRLTEPERTVPVITVPWPLMEKQWSTDIRNGPEGSLAGMEIWDVRSSMSSGMPCGASVSGASGPPGLAATGMMGAPRNLVFSRVFCIFLVIFSIAACLFPSGRRSVLFSTTTSFWQAICPITRHSADWVCIPLVTSMTSIIKSMIWAPPMMVRMREACPGQSTSVICSSAPYSGSVPCGAGLRRSGSGTEKHEKPRSSVMPRSRLCGCLSKAAVEAVVLSARASAVLPLSMWPRTPTFTFTRRPAMPPPRSAS